MKFIKDFKTFNEERTINDFEINAFVTWLDSNVEALAVSNIEATYTEYMKYRMTLSKQEELSYKQLSDEDKAAIEKELETRGMALSEKAE